MVSSGLINGKLSACGETKVSNLDIIDAISATADENVLRFQIAMNDTQTVNMSKTLEYLSEKSPDFGRILM